MPFALTVALKYLIPRWRQLSVSIISLISILVISLVVWLVILFLSVTEGMERKWVEELVALNAPVRLAPTEKYYNSYYYQIDKVSSESDYGEKTIGEKLSSPFTDPYDPDFDAELPLNFPYPDKHKDGSLRDPVKEAYEGIAALSVAGIHPKEYEVSFGNLRLQLGGGLPSRESYVNQVTYVASFDEENSRLQNMLLPLREEDRFNLEEALSSDAIEDYVAASPCTQIPCGNDLGDGVVLAKHFQANGARVGDRGELSYYAPASGSMQEQKIPIYVAGFYDPGVMPIGSKLLFVDPQIAALLRGNISVNDTMLGNGINVWLKNLSDADRVKETLTKRFDELGIGEYWNIESYNDFEFAKPILQQLKSDKNLFTLIAVIILLVACSNIISMLILLVNDKRKEIGILQAMGASPRSIATIFGICGFVTGIVSCIIGMLAALFTLKHLQSLVDFLSFLQGHEAFQTAFYGSKLPNQVSVGALVFVVIATMVIALLAGIIPAVKAAKIRPTEILRAD
ncbi:MAG: Lipoprotein-releasing system transmembrane protein LolC [Chlamydiae bacterium]|nr:Lipoprotein-releasing system transmembrane protein LolC [Chlamydiota bacterium]